ncbi:MAG TPA: hypothetical protein DEB23_05500 [Chitinophagaceae bacterium]|nr:hypothetical protein [Chitinophagaceae bacterium]
MTPKEKAKQLFEKIFFEIQSDELGRCYQSAKQCTLIAVNEILKAVNNEDETYLMRHSVNYWSKVKQELELL